MKTMKKLASLTLALFLTLALAAPALAATVTINPPESGVTETYTAYKILEAKVDGENKDQTVENPNGTASTFTSVAYSISNNSPFYSVFTTGAAATAMFDVTDNGDGTSVVKLRENMDTAENAAALAEALMGVENKGAAAATTTAGTAFDLTDGYFLIVGSLGSKAILDTFGKEAVNIQTKNELPTLTKKILVPDETSEDADATKEVDSTTASYGDTITFQITVNIPASVDDDITVTDTMAEGLTYGNLVQPTTVTKAEGSMTFTIPAGTAAGEFKFQYTATLNGGVATATAYPNTATLTYKGYMSASTEPVNVYTYEIDIFKYRNAVVANGETEGDKIALPGAGFVLMNADGKYYSKDETTNVVEWVNAEVDATEVESTEEATANVKFLGLANGTYTLHEKTVPTGYNRAADVNITIADANHTSTEVVNLTGAELPSTGSIGTTIFYVVGGLLVVGAGILLVTRKRAGEEE